MDLLAFPPLKKMWTTATTIKISNDISKPFEKSLIYFITTSCNIFFSLINTLFRCKRLSKLLESSSMLLCSSFFLSSTTLNCLSTIFNFSSNMPSFSIFRFSWASRKFFSPITLVATSLYWEGRWSFRHSKYLQSSTYSWRHNNINTIIFFDKILNESSDPYSKWTKLPLQHSYFSQRVMKKPLSQIIFYVWCVGAKIGRASVGFTVKSLGFVYQN